MYSRLISGTQMQYHVFPNQVLKVFDTQNLYYLDEYDYKGEVKGIVSSRDYSTAHFSFFLEGTDKISKYNFLEKKVVDRFFPLVVLDTMPGVVRSNLDSCEIKGLDFYFDSSTVILVTIECHRIDEGRKRDHFLV